MSDTWYESNMFSKFANLHNVELTYAVKTKYKSETLWYFQSKNGKVVVNNDETGEEVLDVSIDADFRMLLRPNTFNGYLFYKSKGTNLITVNGMDYVLNDFDDGLCLFVLN